MRSDFKLAGARLPRRKPLLLVMAIGGADATVAFTYRDRRGRVRRREIPLIAPARRRR